MTILHLDASINGENSASRVISKSIVDQLKSAQWGEQVVYRDLTANPLPHLTLDAFADTSVLDEFMAADTDDPATLQWQAMFRETLAEALDALPEKQRNVFVWNELEDMTLQQIADQEKENIKTIISRKRYAVQHLRKRLEFLNQEFFDQ